MLHRPWAAPLVVGFWCVTVGWLAAAKILPSFLGGMPPSQTVAIGAGHRFAPVGWTVNWNGSPIGWALAQSHRSAEGGVTVDNRLHCDRLPLDEMLPAWVGSLVRRSLPEVPSTTLDTRGRVVIDASGRLQSFASTVMLPGTAENVVLEGTVDPRGDVRITLRAGDLRYETTTRVPEQVMMGDEMSPHATLPGLYEGRRWIVPVYSPLRPGTAPLQILHAVVGGEETIFWGNRLVNARVVTYRDDPSSPRPPRCRLWVDRSGRVLRQESTLLGGSMEFVRRTDTEAERLASVAELFDAAAETDAPPEAAP
jgi:hypothetical protein